MTNYRVWVIERFMDPRIRATADKLYLTLFWTVLGLGIVGSVMVASRYLRELADPFAEFYVTPPALDWYLLVLYWLPLVSLVTLRHVLGRWLKWLLSDWLAEPEASERAA